MASWYQAMASEGAVFHYVSNSPLELWPVLRAFLALAGFPHGSCTLKEYGGASSAIAKLWEEPGQRKRANVEMLFKEFPEAQCVLSSPTVRFPLLTLCLFYRFILIGDSGEQDLELYRSLALQYPRNVLAIYIRDVTTPFTPPRTSSGSTHAAPHRANTASPAPPPVPPRVEWQHAQSATDLASLVADEQDRGRAQEMAPFSEMPDLPGQFDGAHERPLLARRNSGSEVTVRTASPVEEFSAGSKAAPPAVPPRPPLGARTRTSPFAAFRSPTSSRPSSPTRESTSAMSGAPTPTASSRSSTRSSLQSDSLMDDQFSDPLSPNNPLRHSPPPSRAEPGTQASVEAFYKRVADAERGLPDGVVLRLFRHGNECGACASRFFRTVGLY